MSTVQLDQITKAEWLEGITYKVPSRRDPHATYHCCLTDYAGNGSCACDDFQFNLGPLLSRMVKPEQALQEGLIRKRDYQDPDGSETLMCWHLVRAHRQFEKEVLAAIIRRQAEAREG